MDKKKKIIAIIACVLVITGIFCISSFATDEDIYIEEDIVFTLNSTISSEYIGNTYNVIWYKQNRPDLILYNLKVISTTEIGNSSMSTIVSTNNHNVLILKSGQTINSSAKSFLENSSNIQFPPPPPEPIPEAITNVKETFNYTLTLGTLIISWLVANQIALAGLYLYILIALISVMMRFFVT